MGKFGEWCMTTEAATSPHKLSTLKGALSKRAHAIKVVAEAVPGYYADPKRVAGLLRRLGRNEVAKYIDEKLPTSVQIRSGDLGEILCNAYVLEGTAFKLGIKRLRWKDHRNMSMRGEDVLAFHFSGPNRTLNVLKAEVKSRAAMTSKVIEEARASLDLNKGLPSAHAISFVADKLSGKANAELRDALDDAQLKKGLKTSQVTHMIFTFSGSNPTKMLTTNLTSYSGKIQQNYVALQVDDHQLFVKSIFQAIK